jgi:hypothetical protein
LSHVNSVKIFSSYSSRCTQTLPSLRMLYTPLICHQSIALNLSDPTSNLVRQHDFPVPLRCRKTSDTVFVAFVPPAVGACPTIFLM